uniref:TCTP domain-containing protein n=2 Tax=Panagrellus redivivus TaxID=6233 RepID=A0A7E5A287_PANRE
MSSSASTQNAIKRFTHDWLIRFCELHPTDKASFIRRDYDIGVPLSSKYCRISTYFTTIIQRYAPIIIMRSRLGDTTQDDIKSIKMSTPNKTIVLTAPANFQNVEPGTIAKYINQQIYFNMNTFHFEGSVLNLDEFKFCLKQCKVASCLKTSFSTPVLYSDIWHLLRNYMNVYLDVENLIFDDKMPQMLKQFPQNTPKEWKLYNMSFREDFVLSILNNFMKSPIENYVLMKFRTDPSKLECERMANFMEAKFIAAGFTVETSLAFGYVEGAVYIYKLSDNIVCLRYCDGP